MPFADRPRTLTWRDSQLQKEGGRPVNRYVERTMAAIDLRDSLMEFPGQKIITRDNVEITVHPVV